MGKFLVWCILLVCCWPLALLALVLYPIVWILLIPFRIVGIPDEETVPGAQADIFRHYGISMEGLSDTALKLLPP